MEHALREARSPRFSALHAVPDDRPVPSLTCAVVGLGYVGLPTALGLYEAGNSVIGIDVDHDRLQRIATGEVDASSRDRTRLPRIVASGELSLTHDAAALGGADVVIVCVPTPVDAHMVPDLTALGGAAQTVVEHATAGQLIVLTSTSYVGCTRDLLAEPLSGRGLVAGHDVHVAFSPERIDPGVEGHRPESTPRIVGGVTRECTARAAAVLESTCPTVHQVASPEIAEMAKLLENTFRAVNIALVNEMADIARDLRVPIEEVIDAAATKPYGFMAFRPGPGVGGHCIPCDPHYLTWQMRASRHYTPLIDVAMSQIAARPSRVVARAREMLADRGRAIAGSHVHVVGVAYKPGVADVRESPALEIIEQLVGSGAHVTFDDPLVESLRIGAESMTRCRTAELDGRPDLVLVHTRPVGMDLAELAIADSVLDATFELRDLEHREVV
jgi:nucleotide sugar dehydrogenase